MSPETVQIVLKDSVRTVCAICVRHIHCYARDGILRPWRIYIYALYKQNIRLLHAPMQIQKSQVCKYRIGYKSFARSSSSS
jgi:hypothetical protein